MSDATSTLDVAVASRNVGGRPTVKTPENREKILAAVRDGSPKTCAIIGIISRAAFHEWENEDPEFVVELEVAEQVYFNGLRKDVEAGVMINGTPDWRAKWEILKARDRKTYGKPEAASSVTVNNTANITVQITAAELTAFQERERAALEALNCGRN